MSAQRSTWLRRHVALVVAAAALLALGADAGYQVYASRLQHRNAVAVAKVEQLSKSQCGQTRFLYAFLNALAEDSSARFGSPRGGPIVPGARAALIGQLYGAERASRPRLRAQGCIVPEPPG